MTNSLSVAAGASPAAHSERDTDSGAVRRAAWHPGALFLRGTLVIVAAAGFILYAAVLALVMVPMLLVACVRFLVRLSELAPVPVIPVPELRLAKLVALPAP